MDYYNNEDNEGHYYFQFINFLPFDVTVKKGEAIGQMLFQEFRKIDNDKPREVVRKGGMGSTDENIKVDEETEETKELEIVL